MSDQPPKRKVRRPRLTAKTVRGLEQLAWSAQYEIQDASDAGKERAIEYIQDLAWWFDHRGQK